MEIKVRQEERERGGGGGGSDREREREGERESKQLVERIIDDCRLFVILSYYKNHKIILQIHFLTRKNKPDDRL